MSRVGVITALKLEAGSLGRHPAIRVRVCGVAGSGIDDAVHELSELGNRLIVSWGTAGALSPRLRSGDLVLPERVVSLNGDTIATDSGPRNEIRRLVTAGRPVVGGTLLESDHILATGDAKRRAGREHHADAVDMESGRVGEACAALRLPFLVIRAIVDELDDRVPGRVRENTSPDGSLRPALLLAGLLLHPGEWAATAGLARRYHRARAGLRMAAWALAEYAAGRP